MINAAAGGGVFTVQCFDAQGRLKWTDTTHNLVVNAGLQDMNAQYFTGVGYTAVWYLGLWGAEASNTPAPSDTMASHPGWTEFVNYTAPSRPVATFSAATTADPSVISNTASPATFVISGGGGVVGGAFLTSNNTKGGTTGKLFSGADFSFPGDKLTVAGDILSLTYTFNLYASTPVPT